jgi:hypothetical protein
LTALWTYYATVGDLPRAKQLVDALRTRLEDMPDWYRAATDLLLGVLAVLRGQFDTARATLEATAAAFDEIDSPEIEGMWFAPNDPVAGMYAFLAFTRFIQGDLAGAEAAFANMETRCEKLRFPYGAFSLCYGRSLETFVRLEAGQLDRAAELVEEVARRGQQHSFDEWVMIASCNRDSMGTRAAMAAGEINPERFRRRIDAMTGVVDLWRAAEMKTFLACYDDVLARLLSAAGMKDQARERVGVALQMADETGMHYYDAELLRTRALTYDDPEARHAGLRAAIELAQAQGAPVFELRAAADDFELLGEPARTALADAINRFPAEQSWPELARARALLG